MSGIVKLIVVAAFICLTINSAIELPYYLNMWTERKDTSIIRQFTRHISDIVRYPSSGRDTSATETKYDI